MTHGKGYKDITYATRETLDATVNRFIESENETERTAARMLKAMAPLMVEILESADLRKLSGFVRGVSDIAASMVASLPPHMREGVSSAIRDDLDRAFRVVSTPEEER